MATCFDSTESSSGLSKDRSKVSNCYSTFWEPPNAYNRLPCCHKNILCNELLLLTEIYTLCDLDNKHIGMISGKFKF